jgi:Icc-related predicted phosphoesterase
MSIWFFVSDLHGICRVIKALQAILAEKPEVVLLGGDVLPTGCFISG